MTQTSSQIGGRYKLVHKLGRGGFGKTYLAQDQHLKNKLCAVKHLICANNAPGVLEKARELFKREAEALEDLGKHNQIPELFNYFQEAQEFYLIQEFIGGESFEQELTSRFQTGETLSETEVRQFLAEILTVLQYVHHHKVIHRDIKPENIMRRLEDHKLVLIDFGGIKRVVSETSNSGKTATVLGTNGYASPEQLLGKPQYNSDIYAVGMTAIRALTGKDPQSLSRDQSSNRLLWQDSGLRVSDDFIKIIDRMIEYDYRNRYQCIQDILNDLNFTLNPNNLSQANTILVAKGNSFISTISTISNINIPVINIPLKLGLIALVPVVMIVSFFSGFIWFRGHQQPNDSNPTTESSPLPSPISTDQPSPASSAISSPDIKPILPVSPPIINPTPKPMPTTKSSPITVPSQKESSTLFKCPDSLKGKIPSCP